MKKLILIFCVGAFSALAMAPINFWPALFVGLSSLYICLCKTKTPSKAAMAGFMFSLGYFGFSLAWVGNALLIEDNPYVWAWPLAVSGLPALLSLFTAIGCYVYKALYKDANNVTSYVAFVTCLFISEYARGHLLTGFPWNLYGYTWIDILPIAQVASLSSIYLLTLVTIFWASAPAFLLTSQHNKVMKAFITIILISSAALSYMYGAKRIHDNPVQYNDDYEIIIIQPNIAQSEKWKPENRGKNFVDQIELSKYQASETESDALTHYIIWPETALSQDIMDTQWAMAYIRNMLRGYSGEAYLITGALRYDREQEAYFNSVITFNSNAEIIHTYDKSHLVPFGEYMPFENIVDIAPIVGFSGFKQGGGKVTLTTPEGIKFSPLICYEIIFPNKVIENTAPRPDMIVNLTNDGWYGDSPGPYQHLVQSQFRAIETGIPILRSANTGISVIISPLGEILTIKTILQKGKVSGNLPYAIIGFFSGFYTENVIILLLISFLAFINICTKLANYSVLHRNVTKR